MWTPHSSGDTSTNNIPADFAVTKEHRRFAEFCEACRRYRHIGLCYGPPGVGKTLSARYYAQWDTMEVSQPVKDASITALADALDSDTVFCTPPVVNTHAQVERDSACLRSALRSIRVEHLERQQRVRLDAVRKDEREQEKEPQRRIFTELDWFADPPPTLEQPPSQYLQLSRECYYEVRKIGEPTTLVLIDEADRLKMEALEQVRDIFDKGGIGLVLIGMPGMEKRLSCYPQLYSPVGFVHAFRPLSAVEMRGLLQHKWLPSGVVFPGDEWADEDTLAAIIRMTGGNFRLLHRLITQMARLVEINALHTVACQVVEAARERLVIGMV